MAKVQTIARVCHEINRAYCHGLGDDSQVEWDRAEQWQRDSAKAGVTFRMQNQDAGPDAMHNNWMADKIRDGWRYGEVKDPEAKTHPCIVPFDQLPAEQQVKDYLFAAVVDVMTMRLREPSNVSIKVASTPAPDLPPELRTQLEMACRNGMVTVPGRTILVMILTMAAVLVARGEGHIVDQLMTDLEVVNATE